METMKAVVKYGQVDGAVEVRDVPVPEISDNDVLLRVRAAGVCGSDIEMWRHRFTYKVNTPVIQGHEFCGTILEVGRQWRKKFSAGQKYSIQPALTITWSTSGWCPTARVKGSEPVYAKPSCTRPTRSR